MIGSKPKVEGLEERYIQMIGKLASALPDIQKIILFGSRAKGTHEERSDVDLCLVLEENAGLNARHFRLDLEEDTVIPYQFDVVYLDEISDSRFKEEILKTGVVIYEREG